MTILELRSAWVAAARRYRDADLAESQAATHAEWCVLSDARLACYRETLLLSLDLQAAS